MSRPNFDVVDSYVGTGSLAAYDFQFKIERLADLLVITTDASGDEVERVRGTDTTVLIDNVVYDNEDGGGTVTLLSNLTSGYHLYLIQANDTPVQTREWKEKGTFTKKDFEMAMDECVGATQRLAYLAGRMIRLNDTQDASGWDMQLPLDPEPGRTLVIGDDGTSFAQGPTEDQLTEALNAIQDAQDAADAAAVSATAAAASAAAAATSATNAINAQTGAQTAQAAAEAAQAAAESAQAAAEAAAASVGFLLSGPFTVVENSSATLTGLLYSSATYTQVDFVARIIRGTTVFARVQFSIMFRNGAWELAEGESRYLLTAHGVTFTVDSTTGQVTAAADNSGAGNASITIQSLTWAA